MSRPLARLLGAGLLAFLASSAGAAEFLVRPVTIVEWKAVFGEVQSRIVVPARARIGGIVREVRITEGDRVEEGQAIALVVDDKLALQLDAAEARIEAFNAQLQNARAEFERAQQLQASGTGTRARLDQAKAQFEIATNQVAAATAEKAVIAQSAREGEVLAPAAGRVLTVPVTLGSVVMPGEAIARVAPGPYYLRLSLPERHAPTIGQDVDVKVGGRGAAAPEADAARPGRIVKIYPEIADGRVIADVEVAGIGDYFVRERTLVSVPVGKREALAVPPAAVRTLHGVDYVRIAGDGGERDVAVVLGEHFEADGEPRVEVLTGLVDGDRAVLP